MINFCHIMPTPHLNLTKYNQSHLLLAHLIETDLGYRQYYSQVRDGKEKIMDNGGFEKFKAGEEMYSADKLIEMAQHVKADIIVLPDYPKQPSHVTVDAAQQWIPKFVAAGFGTFFVPQSEVGCLEDYIDSVEWALNNPDIDVIGLSILGCPIALGLQEQTYDSVDQVDGAYKMQRFLSRWKILQELDRRGCLDERAVNRFHCLGMVDGPNEIDLLRPYTPFIRSWDSSSAPWLGLHGKKTYDVSPTGLRYGKYEAEVNFSFRTRDDVAIQSAITNMRYINEKLGWD